MNTQTTTTQRNGRKKPFHHPLARVDYQAIIRVLDDQESELAQDEQVALDKVKGILAKIMGGGKRT
jgi:hypothetical protein